jgi:hypothetical protein
MDPVLDEVMEPSRDFRIFLVFRSYRGLLPIGAGHWVRSNGISPFSSPGDFNRLQAQARLTPVRGGSDGRQP